MFQLLDCLLFLLWMTLYVKGHCQAWYSQNLTYFVSFLLWKFTVCHFQNSFILTRKKMYWADPLKWLLYTSCRKAQWCELFEIGTTVLAVCAAWEISICTSEMQRRLGKNTKCFTFRILWCCWPVNFLLKRKYWSLTQNKTMVKHILFSDQSWMKSAAECCSRFGKCCSFWESRDIRLAKLLRRGNIVKLWVYFHENF